MSRRQELQIRRRLRRRAERHRNRSEQARARLRWLQEEIRFRRQMATELGVYPEWERREISYIDLKLAFDREIFNPLKDKFYRKAVHDQPGF